MAIHPRAHVTVSRLTATDQELGVWVDESQGLGVPGGVVAAHAALVLVGTKRRAGFLRIPISEDEAHMRKIIACTPAQPECM
jgi:hypothetical protein